MRKVCLKGEWWEETGFLLKLNEPRMQHKKSINVFYWEWDIMGWHLYLLLLFLMRIVTPVQQTGSDGRGREGLCDGGVEGWWWCLWMRQRRAGNARPKLWTNDSRRASSLSPRFFSWRLELLCAVEQRPLPLPFSTWHAVFESRRGLLTVFLNLCFLKFVFL